jgi:hypothetical protein
MKAAIVTAAGTTPKYGEFENPTPKGGEVRRAPFATSSRIRSSKCSTREHRFWKLASICPNSFGAADKVQG